ncbi:lactadherin-like [Montipora foliosa]|uniref:lactadherin-like n=1 Tax=Montipora foliosa TaxID=591990 RepID=UPI0035F1D9DF
MAYFRKYAANRDYVNVVITSLDKPIIGRYIRIHTLEWHGHISFRFELYGWYSGFPTPEPPACMASLRLDSRKVPDSAITASSIANANYKASNGLLQAQPGNGGYRWIPSSQNNQEWFQVDFGSWTKVARIAIQGRQNAAQWLTKFKLTYSYDGLFFKEYIEGGRAKIISVENGDDLVQDTQQSNGGGWISQFQDDKQFLQVDLGAVSKVTGSGLQGRADAGWWTKSFTLSYSNDGANFTPYDSGKVFQENTDNKTPAGHILETPIFARFLKININTFHGYPTLRVELYGCTRGKFILLL